MKFLFIVFFILNALFAYGEKILQTELQDFLVRAQAALQNRQLPDEDIMAELQRHTANFNVLAAAEPPHILQKFFLLSSSLIEYEKDCAALAANKIKKRRQQNQLAGWLGGGGVSAAAVGGILLGLAQIPYQKYKDSYETAEAIQARKQTVACLVPSGIFLSVAGGLILSSIVLAAYEPLPYPSSHYNESKIQYKNSRLMR